MSELKAFAVGEMDIYAAESVEQALKLANGDSGDGITFYERDDVIEIVDEDLDKEYPELDENEFPTGGMTSIRIWLSEAVTPGWLCGSDW